MDLHYRREASVGLLVIVAGAIVFGGLLFLNGRSVSRDLRIVRATFPDVSGLTSGDPVQVSGVTIGRVGRMRLESAGRVIVELEVRPDLRPRADARVTLAPLDLFGAQRIAYAPGSSEAFLPDDSVLAGARQVALMDNAAELADQAGVVLDGLGRVVAEENTRRLVETMESTRRALDAFARVAEGPLLTEVTQTMRSLRDVAERLDSALAGDRLAASLARVDSVSAAAQLATLRLADAALNMQSILVKIDSAQGALGMAVNDSTLAVDAHQTMEALRLLLEDIRERPGRYINARVSIF